MTREFVASLVFSHVYEYYPTTPSQTTKMLPLLHVLGRSSQILNSKQCNPLICDNEEGHKASTQTKFH